MNQHSRTQRILRARRKVLRAKEKCDAHRDVLNSFVDDPNNILPLALIGASALAVAIGDTPRDAFDKTVVMIAEELGIESVPLQAYAEAHLAMAELQVASATRAARSPSGGRR